MLSEDERKAEQALALYTAAFSAEFCINFKLVTTDDAKFSFSLKCYPPQLIQNLVSGSSVTLSSGDS